MFLIYVYRSPDWNCLAEVESPIYFIENPSSHSLISKLGKNVFDLKRLNFEYYTILPSIKIIFLEFPYDDIMESEEVGI